MGRRSGAQNHESRAYPHGLTHLLSGLSDSWRLPARLPGPASSPTHAMESSPRGGTGHRHGFRAFAAVALAFAALTGFSATAQAQNNPATGRPVITGTAQVGQELFASPGNVVDVDGTSNVSPSYQWIRVDSTTETDITGATTTTYTPVTDDVGKQLKVRLSFTDDLGNPESLTSRATGTVMAATATRQQPTLTIDVDPNRFSEDAGTVIICVVPSAVSSQRITVHAATADGTATAPGDYDSYSGTLLLSPQQRRACFTLTLVDDAEVEGDETFTVRLSNPVNATLGTPAVATFTIEDNDDTALTDRAALVAFYNATGGANWTFNTNWLSNEPLSEWRGVTTNDDGRVTELDLRNNQLTGEIPVELSQLAQLESLALGSNRLKVEIPEELGQLSRLQRLDLRNNQLTGEIPEELAQLPQLETLNLSSNQLTGEIPAELSQLPQLESLSLFGNQLTGEIPVELAQLPQLETLNLSGNQLTGEIPAELSQLPQLRILYLFGNQLTGEIPVELTQLTQLESLALGSNQLTGEIPVELSQLTQLQELSLDHNQLTGPIPVELAQLSQLEGLDLSRNQLTGEIPVELAQLPQLIYLDLSDNPLKGEIPAELAELSQLRHLYLRNNQLTGEIPVELAQLPQLETLDLSDNPLTGEIPVELAQLPQLRHLDLSRNQLTGEIPEELGSLTNLQKLYLSRNTLSGEIPEELGNLGSLQYLYLNDNQLTGEIPSWLVRLTQLRELALWGNQLTGTIPPEVAPAQDRAVLRVFYNATGGGNWADNTAWLSNAPLSAWHGVITDANGRVTSLSLSANGLTGTIPPELENLDQLQVFDIRNTGLCVTAGSELHTWLATINFQGSVCGSGGGGGGGGGGFGGGGGGPRTSAPGAVRNLMVAGGNGQVVLTWRAPASDGGAEITDYEYRINGRNPWVSIGSTNTTHTVTDLVNGTAYVFEVRAVNRIGKGRASSQAEATPVAPEVLTLDFTHFANGKWHHLRSGVRERGECASPARYLFLRHRGQSDCRRIGGGHHRRSGDPRGRCADGPDGDGAAGRTHDPNSRPRRVSVGIGEGGLGRSHRRDAPL